VEAVITLVLKFFSDIVSNVLNTAFNTLGETNETIDEIGKLSDEPGLRDLLDNFKGL